MMRQIILASGSPRRKALLERIMEDFEVIPSGVEESAQPGATAMELAMNNALAKAMDVAREHPGAVVIGADTVVVLDDEIMGKPTCPEDAGRMLGALSGRTHRVVTGIAVVNLAENITKTDSEITVVTFRELSGEQIERYVREKKPMDKAGAYGIQEVGDGFVEHLEGNYDNVVGLPLGLLERMLESLPDACTSF